MHPRLLRPFLAAYLLGCLGLLLAQTTPKPDASKSDYSKEAFVDEEDFTKVTFENDGTGTRELTGKVRIQSEAGIQRYSVLSFSYQQATENIDIDYVRVRKPDGSVVLTPLDNIQDMPSEITREAPFYSDLHEKHVAVKGLSAGEVLEMHVLWHIIKPLAPGQFWLSFNFARDYIAVHQVLQVSVPSSRAIKWKSPGLQPVTTEENGRKVFTWSTSHLREDSSEERKQTQQRQAYDVARGKLPAPEIQMSSFRSWDDVGSWYNSLQMDRLRPDADVHAKAAELTKNASDENAKLHILYNYVSTQFRYIGVAFGIGRYQPHPAADVLANQYGDCKDKHTLLASLLSSIGISSYPALISTSYDLDLDVPSPAQFDHVITAVPQGNNYLWLDTTAEVAPFGYLLSPLRDKQALVIPDDKPATLVATPANPTAKAIQTFKIDAKLNDNGTLDGKIERSIQGDDSEVLLRLAFRRVPTPQWKDLVQKISYGSGFSGDVSEVTASLPELLDEPFRFSYNYTRKDFPDWSARQINSPLPPLPFPDYDEKPSNPLWLGMPAEANFESHVTLPKGYLPRLPKAVHLKHDFADYDAIYSVKDGIFSTNRHVLTKLWEIPLSDLDEYKKFRKAVDDDYNTQTVLSTGKSSSTSSYQDEIWLLPYSDNQEAARAYDEARDDYQKHDAMAEIASLEHAVEMDPKFTRAWLWLGEIHKSMRQYALALNAFRAAIDVDQQPVSYKATGYTLMAMHNFEEALPVWRELAKVAPESAEGPSELAWAFFNLKRYSEEAASLEDAIKIDSDDSSLRERLGSAYLHSGDDAKAISIYKKTLEIDPSTLRLNDIAYELAEADKNLPLAQTYAEKAVHDEEEASSKVELKSLTLDDLYHTGTLAAYWDTLGWVYFRQGKFDEAETLLNASWTLTQGKTEADHLLQARKQQHKNLSLPDSSTFRTTKLPRLAEGEASAEFFLLFVRDSKTGKPRVEDVKFISGTEKLRAAEKTLRSSTFSIFFPDNGPTHLVRRGILGCYHYSGCSFVLFLPRDVHSVD